MRHFAGVIVLALGVTAGAAGGYWYARQPAGMPASAVVPQGTAAAAERKILYYRDPSGAPYWSAEPKKDAGGRDYLPAFEDEEISFEPGGKKPPSNRPPHSASQTRVNALMPGEGRVGAAGPRKIIYYRNPMGLPDTSPVPKKDWMGMDYIPVYEGEEQDDGKTVKVSLDKIQRSGVRTEMIEPRLLVQPVRAVGTVTVDERRLTVVALRSDAFVEDLFVNATGQSVRAGEPLFRVYSPAIVSAQVDFRVATGVDGGAVRLRNLGVPESHIRELRGGREMPRTIDWPAPASGTVISKRIVNGQRVQAGDELYRIADLSNVWVIADVAESDLAAVSIGMPASVTLRAYPMQPFEGAVTFIYPEVRTETRTARVRIEVPNPDGRLKIDMYADVVFQAGAEEGPVVAVPASSVIDSGTRQVVLVAKGEGRFEPRPVKLGRRGSGYVQIVEGVEKGEEVVTSATFLIDAESNLKAALQSFTQKDFTQKDFTQPETPK